MSNQPSDHPVLGRGLASLIPQRIQDDPVVKEVVRRTSEVFEVAIDEIDVNQRQPRRSFDEQSVQELVASIKRHGILQPLVVMKQGDRYELIAGERRLRAARLAGLAAVPVIQRSANDQERLELALVENIQRKDLNAMERAAGYQQLLEDFDLTQEDVAQRLGISRSVVSNTLRFLTLPPVIQQALIDERITDGHAKILLGLPTTASQERFLEHIIREGWSIRETAEQVSHDGPPNKRGRYTRANRDPELAAAAERLESTLKTKVRIIQKKTGGKIEIEYYSNEELRRLLDSLTDEAV